MNEYAGESGGGSTTPQPTVDYEPVEMDTASVKAFGEALVKDADNMELASDDISDQLKNPTAEYGAETRFAVGADPRQETLHSIVVEHSQRMHETKILLGNVSMSLRNTGLICQLIASQLGDGDALNGASVEEVEAIIGDVTKPKTGDV